MDHRWEVIAAKSNSQDSGMGLSFATHAMDTAGMMTLLYHQWLSESVRAFLADQLFPAVRRHRDVTVRTFEHKSAIPAGHKSGKPAPV